MNSSCKCKGWCLLRLCFTGAAVAVVAVARAKKRRLMVDSI